MNLRAFIHLIVSAALASVGLLVLGGCSSSVRKERPIYSISAQTTPPQTVYNRTMAVRPPIVYPNVNGPQTDAPFYLNNFHLDLNNVPVEQAVKAVAGAINYRSYTASTFANDKVTITAIGTVDELLAKIADKVEATVTVDHEHQEVRFMRGNAEQNLYSGVVDEHPESCH